MQRFVSRMIVIVAAVAAAAPAWADWTGKGEAGLVIASGNTDAKTGNAKLELANETGNWKHGFGASALYASDDVGTTAQRWEAFEQSDYNFNPRNFWFGAARYEDDEFSGFEYQAIASTGLGHKFIDSDATKFVATAGVGYKFFETRAAFDEDGVLIAPSDSDSGVVFRGTLDFDHHFTETTSLVDSFIVEAGSDNTFVQNDISLQVKMNSALALAVGYSVRHNTDPPFSFEKTDTLTTVNLVYEIK